LTNGSLVFAATKITDDKEFGIYYLITGQDHAVFTPRILTDDQVDDPQLSPTNDYIMFDKLNCGERDGIYIVDTKHQGQRLYLKDAYSGRWSPDGRRVAYCLREPKESIFVRDLDSGQSWRVTTGYGPHWSPDSLQLCFTDRSKHNSPKAGIVPACGGRRKFLTDDTSCAYYPRWSPDGEFIAFSLNGNVAAYFTGSKETKIIAYGEQLWVGDISPDSNFIAYFDEGGNGPSSDHSYVVSVKTRKILKIGVLKLRRDTVDQYINRIESLESEFENWDDDLEDFKTTAKSRLEEILVKGSVEYD